MKKLIFSSLFAVLLLALCQNQTMAQAGKVYDFTSLNHPPTYPGGIEQLYSFLGKNIKYPKAAADKKIQGNVYLSFIVNEDGTVSDIKADNKLGGGTDEEAIRVLKMAKKWNPGLDNKKPVRVAYKLPVKFTLNKGSNISGGSTAAKEKIAYSNDNTIHNFVSMKNPPTYPGGIAALYKFLGDNIKYPKEASDKKVQGNVFVSFVVEKDGTVTDIKTLRGLGSGTDEEAIRVLKLTKKWNPGLENGKAVKVAYNIPIKFTLAK